MSRTTTDAGEGSGRSPDLLFEAKQNERDQLANHITGKRVGSLHPLLGGVHPASHSSPSVSAVTPRLDTAGLCLYSIPPRTRYTQYSLPQYCSIWGLSSSGSPSKHELITIDFKSSGSCNCQLHDEMYGITTPDPQQRTPDYSGSSIKGIVELIQTPAQMKAEARAQEVHKSRIKELKKIGLSNEQIADLWSNASWSNFGQIKKSEGWRKL